MPNETDKWPKQIDNPFTCEDSVRPTEMAGMIRERAPEGATYFTVDMNGECNYWAEKPEWESAGQYWDGDKFWKAGELNSPDHFMPL